MKKIFIMMSFLVAGCGTEDKMVSVDFNSLIGDPSIQELKTAEKCLSKFATKLEVDLNSGGLDTNIFDIKAYKIFTDSQNNVNIQYSISGIQTLSNGKEIIMNDKKQFINCLSQNI